MKLSEIDRHELQFVEVETVGLVVSLQVVFIFAIGEVVETRPARS